MILTKNILPLKSSAVKNSYLQMRVKTDDLDNVKKLEFFIHGYVYSISALFEEDLDDLKHLIRNPDSSGILMK